ncbi:hypothetical protein I552_8198 [Mycobacterium xenopi 3993]|nr:hypothetical protein I552_8198 [Mycobacterium xenopi 3993]
MSLKPRRRAASTSAAYPCSARPTCSAHASSCRHSHHRMAVFHGVLG